MTDSDTTSTVTLVDVTVQVPKESKDVADLLLTLVKDIRAKKTTTEIVSDTLQPLVSAIDGMDKLSVEAKSPKIAVLSGLLAGQIGEAFMTETT